MPPAALTHARELGDHPVEVVEAQRSDGSQPIDVLDGRVGHPRVHRLECATTERGLVDGARQGVPRTGDDVLHGDAGVVHPRDTRRRIGHGLELVGAVVADAGGTIGVEHDLHRGRDQLLDGHALLARHVPQQVVGHEVGEHLTGVHAEARVRVGEQLRQLRLQLGRIVEPVGRRLEVRVDVDDGGRAHFIIPPETDRSSPVTKLDASLTR
jgi:hypothetical protein